MNDRVNAALLNATYALLVSVRRTQICSINYFYPCNTVHLQCGELCPFHNNLLEFCRLFALHYFKNFCRNLQMYNCLSCIPRRSANITMHHDSEFANLLILSDLGNKATLFLSVHLLISLNYTSHFKSFYTFTQESYQTQQVLSDIKFVWVHDYLLWCGDKSIIRREITIELYWHKMVTGCNLL